MFAILSHSLMEPRYVRDENQIGNERPVMRARHSVALGLDWLTVAAFALVTIFGAQLGIPPAAQYIVFGSGCVYGAFALVMTGVRIKIDYCPNKFLCGSNELY